MPLYSIQPMQPVSLFDKDDEKLFLHEGSTLDAIISEEILKSGYTITEKKPQLSRNFSLICSKNGEMTPRYFGSNYRLLSLMSKSPMNDGQSIDVFPKDLPNEIPTNELMDDIDDDSGKMNMSHEMNKKGHDPDSSLVKVQERKYSAASSDSSISEHSVTDRRSIERFVLENGKEKVRVSTRASTQKRISFWKNPKFIFGSFENLSESEDLLDLCIIEDEIPFENLQEKFFQSRGAPSSIHWRYSCKDVGEDNLELFETKNKEELFKIKKSHFCSERYIKQRRMDTKLLSLDELDSKDPVSHNIHDETIKKKTTKKILSISDFINENPYYIGTQESGWLSIQQRLSASSRSNIPYAPPNNISNELRLHTGSIGI